MKLITVLIPEGHLRRLEDLIREGYYHSRSAAIRAAVRDLVNNEAKP